MTTPPPSANLNNYIIIGELSVSAPLYDFVNHNALPGTGVDGTHFWQGVVSLMRELTPVNQSLLEYRDELQRQIDAWHMHHRHQTFDVLAYRDFLLDIGYLLPDCQPFEIDTHHVDIEISQLAGPQLVVPVDNARYALNAANARWGSLYDALYGTDAIPSGATRVDGYDEARGAAVIAFGRGFLDMHFPLSSGSHAAATGYCVVDSNLQILLDDETVTLREPEGFAGYQGSAGTPTLILLKHHGLHVELHIDRAHRIGRTDTAGIADIVLEAALTTIQDCEDSVAAVDVDEKLRAYRHWLGLMQGSLQAEFQKGDRTLLRSLNPDREYLSATGESMTLPGRSLLLIRNVGHHMISDMMLCDGMPVPETFIDAVVTSLIAVHDVRAATPRNSRQRSIYVVKPKLHGPQEVALAETLFSRIEDLLGLPRNTVKLGIMDEERRTTVNLAACIHAARHRVAFINTGFLDRTGDEIHTSMQAGAMLRKQDIRQCGWLDAYERNNVDIGIACGLRGKAQIGKGMWAMPDLMADMLKAKIAHPKAGANTAWVPSPTAAVLHALHYHQVDVAGAQSSLATRSAASLIDILQPPLLGTKQYDPTQIEEDLRNNAQGILGYVVRWIDFGVGCSKVPDIHGVGLMEDRATLRISSQLLANWLHHGICTHEQVMNAMRQMAKVVDEQNAMLAGYQPMAPDFEHSPAFQTACELVTEGLAQPNGYTEMILHRRRLQQKQASLVAKNIQ